MSFITWTTSHFKADEETRYERKRDAKTAAEHAWRAVCAVVDARDRYRCRACGRRCDPHALRLLDRAERHHIVYLSAGGSDESGNVATLCGQCHSDEHRHLIEIEGNADVAITVYRLPQHEGDTGYISRQETAPHVLVSRD